MAQSRADPAAEKHDQKAHSSLLQLRAQKNRPAGAVGSDRILPPCCAVGVISQEDVKPWRLSGDSIPIERSLCAQASAVNAVGLSKSAAALPRAWARTACAARRPRRAARATLSFPWPRLHGPDSWVRD